LTIDTPGASVSGASPFEFGYSEFAVWYEGMSVSVFEPARATFERLIRQRLNEELSEFDSQRIRMGTSRVKSSARAWAKIVGPKYAGTISTLEDIPAVLDDIVGLRIVCNNLCDVDYMQSIVEDLTEWQDGDPGALGREPDSERRYIDDPKESGYRAYHINLMTVVPQLRAVTHVRGELQVRTLLQDGWGELTHEDTYKPGVELPALVVRLSRRMADLLASVDDLAQDLREELDRLAAKSVESPTDPSTPGRTDPAPAPSDASRIGPFAEALEAETRSLVSSLRRPASLAEIAQRLQSSFGTDIVNGWAGHGSFKSLLLHAVPEVNVVQVGAGYILPVGYDGAFAPHLPDIGEVPHLMRLLRRHDRNAPAMSTAKLANLLEALQLVLKPATWTELGLQNNGIPTSAEINQLTRYARDRGQDDVRPLINRQHLYYLIKMMALNNELKFDHTPQELRDILTDGLVSRAQDCGLVEQPDPERRNVNAWLAAAFERVGAPEN
jgi:ppGpp synthetase/RelA/SpoT-type nucleotidyltranferase